MDVRSDDDLDRLAARADHAIHTEDDGRALIIPPQAVKDLSAELRRLRTPVIARDGHDTSTQAGPGIQPAETARFERARELNTP